MMIREHSYIYDGTGTPPFINKMFTLSTSYFMTMPQRELSGEIIKPHSAENDENGTNWSNESPVTSLIPKIGFAL